MVSKQASAKTLPAKMTRKQVLPLFCFCSFCFLKLHFLLSPPNPLFPMSCLTVSLPLSPLSLSVSFSYFLSSQIRPAELQAAGLVNWNWRVSRPGQ